jgi:hypothetical protein
MQESQDKVATLPDEDAKTFGYVIEWACTGTYRASFKELHKDDSDCVERKDGNLTLSVCDVCGQYTCKYTKSEKHSKPGWASFTLSCINTQCEGNTSSGSKGDSSTGAKPSKDQVTARNHNQKQFGAMIFPIEGYSHDESSDWIENITPTVWCTNDPIKDARVYIFAQKYLMRDLQKLALCMLHLELKVYDIKIAGGGDITELIRYAHEKTSHEDGEDGKNSISDLKVLVMEYAACWSDELFRCKSFRDLLAEDGAIALNFADMLSKRLF